MKDEMGGKRWVWRSVGSVRRSSLQTLLVSTLCGGAVGLLSGLG